MYCQWLCYQIICTCVILYIIISFYLELSMVEKEIQTESMELSVVKKDVSIQFDYLTGKYYNRSSSFVFYNLTDTPRGVHVGNNNLFLIQGDNPQSFNWEQYGLRISVPQGTLSMKETCELSVRTLVGGQFAFPKGTELVSVVYTISIAKPLLKPVKLEIQHCAHLVTDDHTKYLSFVIASSKQLVPPYQFQLLKGGQFYPGNQYGSISLSHFCFLAIIKSLFCPIEMSSSIDNTSGARLTVISSQPVRFESQEITISSSDGHETTSDGLVSQTSINVPQLISLNEGKVYIILVHFVINFVNSDIQLSSLSSLPNDQSTLTEETSTPGLEPSQQSSLATPNIQSPVTSPVQSISTNLLNCIMSGVITLDEYTVISSSPDSMYIGQVVYEVKHHDSQWLMRFIVAKDLNGLLEV